MMGHADRAAMAEGGFSEFSARIKRPNSHDIVPLLATLPAGQRRVAEALIGTKHGRTYPETAALLGVHLGTVYQHLRRMRRRHPSTYQALMDVRADQLARRHKAALERAAEHSRAWHRRQASRAYFYRFGHWPWERPIRVR